MLTSGSLEAVRDHIGDHLADPELDPATIAAAHYISPRYLHAVSQGTGFTVTSWIRDRRLERCRRELADPLLAQVPRRHHCRWGSGAPPTSARSSSARPVGLPPSTAVRRPREETPTAVLSGR